MAQFSKYLLLMKSTENCILYMLIILFINIIVIGYNHDQLGAGTLTIFQDCVLLAACSF